MTLTKEQTSAIKKLSKLRAGAFFMEMDTGKTRTMIELTKKVGMSAEEILRLSLSIGLPELFAGQEFSKSWSVS